MPPPRYRAARVQLAVAFAGKSRFLWRSSRGCARGYVSNQTPRPPGWARCPKRGCQTATSGRGTQKDTCGPRVRVCRGQRNVPSHGGARKKKRSKERGAVWRARLPRKRPERLQAGMVGGAQRANARAGHRRPAAAPSRHTLFPLKGCRCHGGGRIATTSGRGGGPSWRRCSPPVARAARGERQRSRGRVAPTAGGVSSMAKSPFAADARTTSSPLRRTMRLWHSVGESDACPRGRACIRPFDPSPSYRVGRGRRRTRTRSMGDLPRVGVRGGCKGRIHPPPLRPLCIDIGG